MAAQIGIAGVSPKDYMPSYAHKEALAPLAAWRLAHKEAQATVASWRAPSQAVLLDMAAAVQKTLLRRGRIVEHDIGHDGARHLWEP